MTTTAMATATVGLDTHRVRQSWELDRSPGPYMVLGMCGAMLYPRHWDGAVLVVPGTVTCPECLAETP